MVIDYSLIACGKITHKRFLCPLQCGYIKVLVPPTLTLVANVLQVKVLDCRPSDLSLVRYARPCFSKYSFGGDFSRSVLGPYYPFILERMLRDYTSFRY